MTGFPARERPMAAGRARAVLALLFPTLLLLVGCDGRGGSGSWEAVVEGPGAPPGAAVLSLEAQGVEAVEGLGGVEAWFHAPASEPGTLRVVLVAPDGAGELAFRVRVARRDDPAPVGRVLELAGLDNVPLPVTGDHRVRIRSGP
jgi:hypothetical protein